MTVMFAVCVAAVGLLVIAWDARARAALAKLKETT